MTDTATLRHLLGLAATPTLAGMALIGTLAPSTPLAALCSPFADPSGSMPVMYLLMGVFHAGPWLGLLDRRRAA